MSLLPVSSLRFFSNPIKKFILVFFNMRCFGGVMLRNASRLGFSLEAPKRRRDILIAKSSQPFISSSDYSFERAVG